IVSKAREDLPEPERPVITVNRSRGISTLMFLRLCWRAPLTLMRSMAIAKTSNCNGLLFARQVKHRLHRLKVESEAEFHATRRLRRSSLAEEGRCLDS